MAKTNKQTNRSRCTARENQQTSTSNRRTLENSIQAWMSSNKTRPKTVFLTLQRTQSGYTVEECTILNRTNQYGVRPVSVDARTIVTDINRRGLIA